MQPGQPVWTTDGTIIFESMNGLEVVSVDGEGRTTIPGTIGARAPDTPLSQELTSQEGMETASTEVSSEYIRR